MTQADGLTIVHMREKPCSACLFKGIELPVAKELNAAAAGGSRPLCTLLVHKGSGTVGDVNDMFQRGINKSECEPLAAVALRMRAELSAGSELLRASVAGLDGAVAAVAMAREELQERVGACQRSITQGVDRVQVRPWLAIRTFADESSV